MEMSLPLARLDAFERSQSVLNVAAHSYLVVEGSSDYAFGVYDVGNPGGAQTESAPHIVETANVPGCVATQFVRNSGRVAESLTPLHAVGADSDDYCIKRHQFVMGFTETPDLNRSSVSEGSNEEEQDDIPALILREGESFA